VIVIVAEKPSVARDLARVLAPGASAGAGVLRAGDLVFTWALGHLLELAPPEHYDGRLRSWRLHDLPILPERYDLVPRAGSPAPRRPAGRGRGGARPRTGGGGADQLQVVAALLADGRTTEVVNACDAGREGERIFREILAFSGAHPPLVTRLWLSETTPAAIGRAWAARTAQSAYDGLASAADARAEADWAVGMNATRALTVRHRPSGRGLLTAGRVQTPTLALITAREAQIRAFVPEAYFTVEASLRLSDATPYQGAWIACAQTAPDPWRPLAGRDPADEGPTEGAASSTGGGLAARIADRDEAQAVASRLAGRDGAVDSVVRRERREPAPLLFNLNDLQRAANRALGLTARQTLEAAQRLYEGGHLSYPRTESRHITPELAAGVAARLRAAGLPPPAVPTARAACVDARKVGDHYGLLPTDKPPPPGAGRVERAVFDLVARRAAAAFQEAAVWAEARVLTRIGDDWLLTAGRSLTRPGWRAVEPPAQAPRGGRGAGRSGTARGDAEPDGDAALAPALLAAPEGAPARCLAARAVERSTRPPARYTDASLLGAMEHAGRSLDDRALRQAMGAAGLGTAATRAEILEALVRRGYVRREGRTLVPTEGGEALIAAAPRALRSPELTARWEARLADLEHGTEAPATFRAGIEAFVRDLVQEVVAAPTMAAPPAATGAPERRRGGPRAPAAGRRSGVTGRVRASRGRAAPGRAATAQASACPRCQGPMVRTPAAYVCRGTCGARVAARYAGRATRPGDVAALLTAGRTPLRRGFAFPGGEASGRLVMGADGQVRAEPGRPGATRARPAPAKGRRRLPAATREVDA